MGTKAGKVTLAHLQTKQQLLAKWSIDFVFYAHLIAIEAMLMSSAINYQKNSFKLASLVGIVEDNLKCTPQVQKGKSKKAQAVHQSARLSSTSK